MGCLKLEKEVYYEKRKTINGYPVAAQG